jgi:hypothetical protein
MSVDVGSNDKRDDIEEWHPCLLWEEFLRERECEGAGDPADLHDGKEACAYGSANLVEGARAGDDSHGSEVDGVLDWRDLLNAREVRRDC